MDVVLAAEVAVESGRVVSVTVVVLGAIVVVSVDSAVVLEVMRASVVVGESVVELFAVCSVDDGVGTVGTTMAVDVVGADVVVDASVDVGASVDVLVLIAVVVVTVDVGACDVAAVVFVAGTNV